MSDPGSIIALTTIAHAGALKAWSVFREALQYPDESADLVVRLELERFRFQTWALNAGITKGTFYPALHPVHNLVADRLQRIEKLFEDATQLRESFGLSVQEAAQLKPGLGRARGIMSGMAQSVRALGIKLDVDEKPKQPTDALKRLRWGIASKSKFEKLVATLEAHIDKLDEILTESQRRSATSDWNRVNIVVVGQVDEESLEVVSQALHYDNESASTTPFKQMGALVGRKAIALPKRSPSNIELESLKPRNLTDYNLPEKYASKTRFLSKARSLERFAEEGLLLFEKKSYDSNISVHDRQLLKARLERLVLLLSSASSESFRVLRAVGYCHDPGNFCWWMIFHVPFICPPSWSALNQEPWLAGPVSLDSIFAGKFKPPLEQRFQLACKLSKTLGGLYSSSWMHKSIRSDNVLFPYLRLNQDKEYLLQFKDISLPYIAGFEFSRQDSEAATIDKGKHVDDIGCSLYRHPDYQGEAASGYKTYYDFYSLGMVLLEIALWTPLISFLDPIGSQTSNTVHLSSKMKYFHKDEALELRRRVLARLDKEMAFRVGSRYSEAVRWCLTFVQPEETEEWHPALSFYNHVVVPLEKCTIVLED